MKKALTILAGVAVLSACVVTLPRILKVHPVRTASFKGSHVEMAACVRLIAGRGKEQRSPDGARIDIYNAKKIWNSIGVTHYAISVYQDGSIELRKLPSGDLTEQAGQKLWTPIENCIGRAAAG